MQWIVFTLLLLAVTSIRLAGFLAGADLVLFGACGVGASLVGYFRYRNRMGPLIEQCELAHHRYAVTAASYQGSRDAAQVAGKVAGGIAAALIPGAGLIGSLLDKAAGWAMDNVADAASRRRRQEELTAALRHEWQRLDAQLEPDRSRMVGFVLASLTLSGLGFGVVRMQEAKAAPSAQAPVTRPAPIAPAEHVPLSLPPTCPAATMSVTVTETSTTEKVCVGFVETTSSSAGTAVPMRSTHEEAKTHCSNSDMRLCDAAELKAALTVSPDARAQNAVLAKVGRPLEPEWLANGRIIAFGKGTPDRATVRAAANRRVKTAFRCCKTPE